LLGVITTTPPDERRRAAPPVRSRVSKGSRRTAGASLAAAVLLVTVGLSTAAGHPVFEGGEFVLFRGGGPAEAAEPPSVDRLLPYGKGMWIYEFPRTEGGDVHAIVARAKSVGLTHLYVRSGSAWDGFYAGPFLDRLLPAAHAAGIQVFGWDFPRLAPWEDDVARAVSIVRYRTPGKQRLDGFSADIETQSEGTRISAAAAEAYGRALREAVGPSYPLIATVPRPSPARAGFPYAEVVASFDAVAPMVYWLNRQPDTDVAGALGDLAQFGKPVFPIGQAYDGAPEGGRRGVPPRDELLRFAATAAEKGAAGISFWSWQAADQQAWDAIRDAPQFRVSPLAAALLRSRSDS
jgi:hypothetical protein